MKTRTAWMILVFLLLLPGASRARFEMGTLRAGIGLGLRGSTEGTVFAASGVFGVFVLKGVEISISNMVQTGGDQPTLYMLTGGLRFIPLPDLQLTPFIAGEGGRLFIGEGWDDAWVVGVGGGLIYMFGPWYGIEIGAGYRWYFFPGEDPDGIWDVNVGLLLVF